MAEHWASTAMLKRPWRTDFFQAFLANISQHHSGSVRILELGSGPGFLAHYILQSLPACQYIALDFSMAMHALARQRIGDRNNIQFLERDFLQPDWTAGLGKFDVVVTMQAVHELRHKSRASTLHTQVKTLLHPDGHYLVCDHHIEAGGMQDTELYMTLAEQKAALERAGFSHVELILDIKGLALYQANSHT